MMKRSGAKAWLAIFTCMTLLSAGCQEFDRLRLILKPEQFPEGLSGPHRVSIRVVPAQSATLELNGRSIPITETTELRGLRAGEHRLILRAPGYQSFATPMKLGSVEHLDLEVHLQPVSTSQEEASFIRLSRHSNAPTLPEGIHPASVSLRCASTEPSSIDGETIDQQATLNRIYGVLSCGGVEFRYQYTTDGELELGPISNPLEIKSKPLAPGQVILASPGGHTFLLPRVDQPLFPIEIRVNR